MKAQASIELLITIGIVLAFTIPVLFLLLSVTSVSHENTGMAQADASVRSLADSINFVYGEGVGSKRVILLNIPASANSLDIVDGEVVMPLDLSAGSYEAVAPIFADEVRVDSSMGRVGSELTGLIVLEIEAFEISDRVVIQVRSNA